jgi:AIG2-like family
MTTLHFAYGANMSRGLYRAEVLAVRRKRCLAPSLVYFARPGAAGRPKPGYIELVVEAAREWGLPDAYIHSLEDFAPAHPAGTDARKIGEFR